MTTKEKFTQETKAAATIKVKTLVISIAVFGALIASFIGGFHTHQAIDQSMHAQAKAYAQELKAE